MSSIYACPVHVDRQSPDPRSLCPLCGQRPILLRAAADLGGDLPAGATGERSGGGRPKGLGRRPLRERALRPRKAGRRRRPSSPKTSTARSICSRASGTGSAP